MTMEEYREAIEDGPGERTCPFIQKDDHVEVWNIAPYFAMESSVLVYKANVPIGDTGENTPELTADTVIFMQEQADGYAFEDCLAAIQAYINRGEQE